MKSADVLTAFLELYDVGRIKEKLIKNTADNKRGFEMGGKTPANMMLYGTPVKLLDGGPTEKLYEGFLDSGYARRCFFCFIDTHRLHVLSVDERMAILGNNTHDSVLEDANAQLTLLADASNANTTVGMAEAVFRELMTYQVHCEQRAMDMPEHDDMSRAEMIHRYFKCVKLAGALAFFDSTMEITMSQLHGAIKATEESGNAFHKMRNRERDYVRLAKYIASTDRRVTHVDIGEDLSFYPSSGPKRTELISLSMAWAHKNSVVIKKHFIDSIEMFSGSMPKVTNLDELIISHGSHQAYGYTNDLAPWTKMDRMLGVNGYNWVNHFLNEGHRADDDVMQGFNIVVLDVDSGDVPVSTAELLLTDYEYILHTTKSSTDVKPRYRIIMPMSHTLEMDKAEYGQFMENLFDWFPIGVDRAAKDRCRKWATCASGTVITNQGKLLDPLVFIPKTKKDEQIKAQRKEFRSMDGIERWFITNTGDGNRNNNMMRYAFMLADSGKDLLEVQEAIKSLNGKMADSLSEDELTDTIFKSLARKFIKARNE